MKYKWNTMLQKNYILKTYVVIKNRKTYNKVKP